MALAAEVLLTENSDDVWISDEKGHKVAERSTIMDYAEGGYAETDDEN